MLRKAELIHSHILVAMFCGWEPQKPTKTLIFGESYPNGYLKLMEGDDLHLVSNDKILEELPYATDWNYLMTAYDKFRDAAEEGGTDDKDALMDIRDTLIEAILDFNIDLAFKELVRGIETINQLKTEET